MHFDLNVPDGTLTSILGPSGCGKTTTLRMIAGFETPESGDVLFDGVSVSKVPVNQRGIGMVFQSYALFPHMTVGQNVSYGLEQQKVKGEELRQRVEAGIREAKKEQRKNKMIVFVKTAGGAAADPAVHLPPADAGGGMTHVF